jgi:tRNA dimethylallyltransferase
MELARRFDLAIMSADSRQVYRGFDVGTAKPTAEERAEVAHFGVDVLDARDRYSAHAWAVDLHKWTHQAIAMGKGALVVGGTGFYVRALVRPLAPAPELDSARRQSLARWLREQSLGELVRWCRCLDPDRASLGRTQLERAIETALLAGRRLSDVHAEHAVPHHLAAGDQAIADRTAAVVPVRYLVLDPGPPLADRIQHRVHAMLDAGWVDEIVTLMREVPATAPAWLASGYEVMRQHVDGSLSRTAAIERVIIETRQYAKRQRTWFRHQLTEGPVTRISPLDPQALDLAIDWWNGTERRA